MIPRQALPHVGFWLALVGCLHCAAPGSRADEPDGLVVLPSEIRLEGNFARAQILVAAATPAAEDAARSDDLTGKVSYVSSDPAVASVTAGGQLTARQNGQATVTITHGESKREMLVVVTGVEEQPHVAFGQHIRPILNKAGCAMEACHAAQHGQGGFKLSVFGFEPDKDRLAMVRDATQRRADFVQPERSLLLQKPTMQTPHGGGKRLEKGSVEYETLLAWIRGGAPPPAANEPEVVRLHVMPARRVGTVGLTQQLRVEAEYASGKRRDVTALARYDSLDDGLLTVTGGGLVTTVGKGQAAAMIRYEGQVAVPYCLCSN
jgi:hypothetical protein